MMIIGGKPVEKVTELTEKELAARWRMPPATLRYWRSVGKGPKYIKREGRVVYRLEDIEAYDIANIVNPQDKNAGEK